MATERQRIMFALPEGVVFPGCLSTLRRFISYSTFALSLSNFLTSSSSKSTTERKRITQALAERIQTCFNREQTRSGG